MISQQLIIIRHTLEDNIQDFAKER